MRADRSFVYAPGRPTKKQRAGALFWLRYDLRYAAKTKRENCCSQHEWVRRELPHYKLTSDQAYGAASFANRVGLISAEERERYRARLDRIHHAKVRRGVPQSVLERLDLDGRREAEMRERNARP